MGVGRDKCIFPTNGTFNDLSSDKLLINSERRGRELYSNLFSRISIFWFVFNKVKRWNKTTIFTDISVNGERKNISPDFGIKILKQLGKILVRERTETITGTMEKKKYRHAINNYTPNCSD